MKKPFSATIALGLALSLLAQPLPLFGALQQSHPIDIPRFERIFSKEAMGFSGAAFRYGAVKSAQVAMAVAVAHWLERSLPGQSSQGLSFLHSLIPFVALTSGAQPHLPAIHLILANHQTEEDGKWVIDQLNQTVAKLPLETPLILWAEQAFPAGVPATMDELQKYWDKNYSSRIDVARAIHTPRNSEFHSELRQLYEAQQKKMDTDEDFELVMDAEDPFGTELTIGIEALASTDRPVEVRFEAAPFASYLDHLKMHTETTQATLHLSNARLRQARRHSQRAIRHDIGAIVARDEALAAAIAQAALSNPSAVQIVIRGASHEKSLTKALRGRAHLPTHVRQPNSDEDAPQNRILNFEIPRPGSRLLRMTAHIILMRSTLIDLFVFFKSLSPDVDTYFEFLCEYVFEITQTFQASTLNEWFKQVEPLDHAFDIGRKTLEWFTQQPEVLNHPTTTVRFEESQIIISAPRLIATAVSNEKSLRELHSTQALAANSVHGRIFAFDDIARTLSGPQISALAQGWENLTSGKNSPKWVRGYFTRVRLGLVAPEKLFVLVSREGKVTGFAVTSHYDRRIARLEFIVTQRESGPSGKGTFLFDTLLKRWKNQGFWFLNWNSKIDATGFYLRFLASRMDYETNSGVHGIEFTGHIATYGLLTDAQKAEQTAYAEEYERRREEVRLALSNLPAGQYHLAPHNRLVLTPGREWFWIHTGSKDTPSNEVLEELVAILTFRPYKTLRNLRDQVVIPSAALEFKDRVTDFDPLAMRSGAPYAIAFADLLELYNSKRDIDFGTLEIALRQIDEKWFALLQDVIASAFVESVSLLAPFHLQEFLRSKLRDAKASWSSEPFSSPTHSHFLIPVFQGALSTFFAGPHPIVRLVTDDVIESLLKTIAEEVAPRQEMDLWDPLLDHAYADSRTAIARGEVWKVGTYLKNNSDFVEGQVENFIEGHPTVVRKSLFDASQRFEYRFDTRTKQDEKALRSLFLDAARKGLKVIERASANGDITPGNSFHAHGTALLAGLKHLAPEKAAKEEAARELALSLIELGAAEIKAGILRSASTEIFQFHRTWNSSMPKWILGLSAPQQTLLARAA